MQIPFQHLKDGKNTIEAYSYLDGGGDSGFHRFTNCLSLSGINAPRLKVLNILIVKNKFTLLRKVFLNWSLLFSLGTEYFRFKTTHVVI